MKFSSPCYHDSLQCSCWWAGEDNALPVLRFPAYLHSEFLHSMQPAILQGCTLQSAHHNCACNIARQLLVTRVDDMSARRQCSSALSASHIVEPFYVALAGVKSSCKGCSPAPDTPMRQVMKPGRKAPLMPHSSSSIGFPPFSVTLADLLSRPCRR